MTTKAPVALVLAALALSAACQDPRASSAVRPSSPPTTAGEARALCTWQAEGKEVVDRQMAELRATAVRSPGKLDAWILLGRAWVRKARETQAPEYYQNAAACADLALRIQPDAPLAHSLQA